MFKNPILADLKKNRIIYLILCIGMLPLWANGYCMYILILLLPIVLFKYIKIDGTGVLVIFFSIIYTLVRFLNGAAYTPSGLIFDLIFPFVMYQCGAYVISRQRNPRTSIIIITLMAICLALPAIIYNIADTIKTGKLINISRFILDDSSNITRSATGYGMMLALMNGCVGIMLIKTYNRLDFRLKAVLVSISIAALFATIHLLNRTGIALAIISIIMVAILPPHSLKKNIYIISASTIAILLCLYFLGSTQFMSDAMELYAERDIGIGAVRSYGGRSERWAAGLVQLFSQPFGNEEGVLLDGQYTYAHNLWIDAGVRGSILCFILLLGITIIYIKNVIRTYHSKHLSIFERDYIMILSMIMLLQMAVEPVIEGLPQFFWFYIFFISVFIHFNKKQWKL